MTHRTARKASALLIASAMLAIPVNSFAADATGSVVYIMAVAGGEVQFKVSTVTDCGGVLRINAGTVGSQQMLSLLTAAHLSNRRTHVNYTVTAGACVANWLTLEP